ncbi:MAG: hypothetical protein AAGF23_01420 [Acidobacteriota bacterium]
MIGAPQPRPPARRAAFSLLLAAVALVAGPLAAEWAHRAPEAADGHGDCGAWKVSTGHASHPDEQFEAAERPRHDHHWCCLGYLTPQAPARVDAEVPSLRAPSSPAVSEAAGPSCDAATRPPTRGPP